ncbi:uncharacterized protein ACA1_050380 [Acanthamoeba castellanii str. Neff]|uniref:Uncharacterized protein n=1 Tax=Acanthamoeba castellanii (strain ATCC 30010 / Neff) TaxID=1257118 RepID=L8H3U6_ACACF|nr:uncharacterized protein ACA1_050380 [Acanthamoeba castellanii str. Neff]ELR19880.1 hypothetical protein ACA1_050380 [Acanthamoeba castellanii str. Neff]
MVVACLWSTSDAVVQVARRSDDFVGTIGFNTHFHYSNICYNEGYERFKALFLALGARHIRDSLLNTTWKTYYDRLNEMGRAGVKSQLLVDYDVPAEQITSLPLRVLDSMELYEGPNELDIRRNFEGDWATTLQNFTKVLWNAHNNSYPVVGPSLTSEAAYTKLGDVSQYVDFGNMHNYFSGRHPGTKGWGGPSAAGYCCYGSIGFNMNVTALSSGDKPIVSSETGYTTGSPRPSKSGQIPFDVQTKYELRMFAMQFIRGVERTLHYEFCDFADDPGMYGIVAVDPEDPSKLTPKPAYHALYNLIRLLADPGPAFTPTSLSYEVAGAPSSFQSLILQRREGTFMVLLWLEEATWLLPANSSGVYANVTSADVAVRLPGGRNAFSASATVYRFNPSSGCMTATATRLTAANSSANDLVTPSLQVDDSILVLQLNPTTSSAGAVYKPAADAKLCPSDELPSSASRLASPYVKSLIFNW